MDIVGYLTPAADMRVPPDTEITRWGCRETQKVENTVLGGKILENYC